MVSTQNSESEYSDYSDNDSQDFKEINHDDLDSESEDEQIIYDDDMEEYLLFVYGTLMSPKLWRKVTGMDKHPIHTQKAVLHNFIGLKVENEAYPGLIPREGSKVVGQVLSIKSRKLMDKIDKYEQDFYTKVLVQVEPIMDEAATTTSDCSSVESTSAVEKEVVVGDDKTLSEVNEIKPSKRSSIEIGGINKKQKIMLQVGVYQWNNKLELEKTEWDYNQFVEYYQDGYLAEL